MPHITLSYDLRTAGIYTEFLVDPSRNDNLRLPDNASDELKATLLNVSLTCPLKKEHAICDGAIVPYDVAYTWAICDHLEEVAKRKQKQQEEQAALEEACKELLKQVNEWSQSVNLFDLTAITNKEFTVPYSQLNSLHARFNKLHTSFQPSGLWTSPAIITSYDRQIREIMLHVLQQAQGIAKAINEQAEIKAQALLRQKYEGVKLYTRIGKAYKQVA